MQFFDQAYNLMRQMVVPAGIFGIGFLALAFLCKPIIGDKLSQAQAGWLQMALFVIAGFGFIPLVVQYLSKLGPGMTDIGTGQQIIIVLGWQLRQWRRKMGKRHV